MSTARILLYKDTLSSFYLNGNSKEDTVQANSLHLVTSAGGARSEESFVLAEDGFNIDKEHLALQDNAEGETYQFNLPQSLNVILSSSLLVDTANNSFRFLGRDFSIDAGYSATLILRLTVNPALELTPSASLLLCGQFQLDATEVGITLMPVCLQLNLDQLFAGAAQTSMPSLQIGLPDFGLSLPKLNLNWSFPRLPDLPFSFSPNTIAAADWPVKISWKSARVRQDNDKIVLDLVGLKLYGDFRAIEGDLHLVWKDHEVLEAESYFDLYQPDFQHTLRLQFDAWYFDDDCLFIRWKKGQINNWLKLLSPDLADKIDAEADISFRLLRNNGELMEIRLDWKPGTAREFQLPGVAITLPAETLYSLVYYKDKEKADKRLAFVVTEKAEQKIIAKSSFAFSRGEKHQAERELHPDQDLDNEEPTNKSFLTLELTAKAEIAGVSVALLDMPLNGGASYYFKQLKNTIEALKLPAQELPELAVVPPEDEPEQEYPFNLTPFYSRHCPATSMELTSLKADHWNVSLTLPHIKLPFLQEGGGQFIQVWLKEKEIGLPEVKCVLGIKLQISPTLVGETEAQATFDLERMAFKVEGGNEISFNSKTGLKGEHLGLQWEFKPNAEERLFTLVTENKNYLLRQAENSVITITYPQIGAAGEPLIFELRDFALTPKGVNAKGRVLPTPIKLGGLNTRFRFTEGEFTILENSIRDFSISGSGALPPKLVGEATADIALQFRVNDNKKLEIVSGMARLRGEKLLDCKSTRFQFAVDGLGLKFVYDGRYHFYFTITGKAKFVPLAGDDSEGPLAWLPGIEMQLLECPLTSDVSVLGKHVKFLVDMPKKPSFAFLGCFKMELRGIGFVPQAPMFLGEAAMVLSGQLMFADGTGDVIDAKIDLHNLYIGLPAPGKVFPRIHFKGLSVKVRSGDAFSLEGGVDFFDGEEIAPGMVAKGFAGLGSLSIQGMPTFTAAFTFIRVSSDGGKRFVKAWFLYVQAEKLSLRVPLFNVFIREVGLGFGYRYTLTSIKKSDELDDPAALIKELRRPSLTQGELSRRDQWQPMIEEAGKDPSWTVVARMMIAQNSAATGITDWNQKREENVPSLFLLDVVLALRSDLTFLMTARGWLNTNYNDYRVKESLRTKPLLSGFVLLSPRKRRLLAHLASNPGAEFGDHPPLPEFLKKAIRNSYFSATLLLEPALLHYELGWPNQLSWGDKLGPISAEFRGGTIFRISRTDIVYGISYQARGSLQLSAKAGGSSVGARISATANVAYGARYIGVIGLVQPLERSAMYGAVGVEVNIVFRVEFWLKFRIGFVKIRINLRFNFAVQLTALLEVGFTAKTLIGASGRATVAMRIMGRRLHFSIHVSINQNAVDRARAITNQYLNIGLEAAEVQPIPGTNGTAKRAELAAPTVKEFFTAQKAASTYFRKEEVQKPRQLEVDVENTATGIWSKSNVFVTPTYSIFCSRFRNKTNVEECYFLLYPNDTQDKEGRQGFLPVPPLDASKVVNDFTWQMPASEPGIKIYCYDSFAPKEAWKEVDTNTAHQWKVNWEQMLGNNDGENGTETPKGMSLESLLKTAYLFEEKPSGRNPTEENPNEEQPVKEEDSTEENPTEKQPVKEEDSIVLLPLADPKVPEDDGDTALEDARVYNPSDAAFEAAVRGAYEQFEGSPYFRRDENSFYEANLANAFAHNTSIYTQTGVREPGQDEVDAADQTEQALHMRSMIVSQMFTDFQQWVEDSADLDKIKSVAFQMGLVFKTSGGIPAWLSGFQQQNADASSKGKIKQRTTIVSNDPDSAEQEVKLFNLSQHSYEHTSPEFQRVRQYADADTIAITWDLNWPQELLEKEIDEQGIKTSDPEEFLKYYLIRRRSLDTAEREAEFKVKPIEVLNLASASGLMNLNLMANTLIITGDGGGLNVFTPGQPLRIEYRDKTSQDLKVAYGFATAVEVKQLIVVLDDTYSIAGLNGQEKRHVIVRAQKISALRPRFKFTDNFNNEPLQDQAMLNRQGKSYLYTIIPVDISGKHSARPLSTVATRKANYPPAVPTESELNIRYKLERSDFVPLPAESVLKTPLLPQSIKLKWTKPAEQPNRPRVAIDQYNLIFRREKVLPIGFYGVDSESEGNVTEGLPNSNARTLRTDLVLSFKAEDKESPGILDVTARVMKEVIGENSQWKPEAWRVFLQTVGENGVPSMLVPVKINLRFESQETSEAAENKWVERQPALLEWITRPILKRMIKPEDEQADVDFAAFPMPYLAEQEIKDLSRLAGKSFDRLLTFNKHPQQLRTVRLRWNQAPSSQRSYPVNLQSAYQLYEYDLDGHTAKAVDNPGIDFLEQIRRIQEVELIPADALYLNPANTSVANQWEAWYPSMVRRFKVQQETSGSTALKIPVKNSKSDFAPWYSWRESYLDWVDDGRMFSASFKVNYDSQTIILEGSTLRHRQFKPGAFVRIIGFLLPENNGLKQISSEDQAVKDHSIKFTNNSFKAASAQNETLIITLDPVPSPILEEAKVITALMSLHVDEQVVRIHAGDLLAMEPGEFIRITDEINPLNNGVKLIDFDQSGVAVNEVRLSGKTLLANTEPGSHITIERISRPALHPLLFLLIHELESDEHAVEIQAQPTMKTDSLELFMKQTSEEQDPYGWNILKLLGLSVTFTIRNRNTGRVLPPDATYQLLNDALNSLRSKGLMEKQLEKQLFIEYLFQPARAVKLASEDVVPVKADLLSLVQLSLRPLARQFYHYHLLSIPRNGNLAKSVELKLNFSTEHEATLIELSRSGAGITLHKGENKLKLHYPAGGEIMLLLRSKVLPVVSMEGGQILAFEQLAITDWSSPHFDVPLPYWQQHFSNHVQVAPAWHRFSSYMHRLNSIAEPKISMPLPNDDALLPALMGWLQRFFDMGSDLVKASTGTENTDAGIKVATAYPRTLSPAALTPDASGRLTYYHRIEDQWAHVYRYYFLPQHRYDKLWEALANSAELFANEKLKLVWFEAPMAEEGGLDVVLDRIKAVEAPLVLLSGRLDLKTKEHELPKPGKVWEVVIAKHPEQSLIERNRTLVRQLDYRQISHTLLRRFAFGASLASLNKELAWAQTAKILVPEYLAATENPALPEGMERLEHLDLNHLKPEEQLLLDLPRRLGAFATDALILQWESLPFYYEHSLLIVAQTSLQVSPVTSVVQRDFEYKTPEPRASLTVSEEIFNGKPERVLALSIRLNNYWDALPEDAQKRWPDENPSIYRHLIHAALPDTDVAYQIGLASTGRNTEAQAEFYYDLQDNQPEPTGGTYYKVMPLGKGELIAGIKGFETDGLKVFRLNTYLRKTNAIQLPKRHEVQNVNGVQSGSNGIIQLPTGDLSLKGYHEQLLQLFPGLQILLSQTNVHEGKYRLKRYMAVVALSAKPALPTELSGKLSYLQLNGRLYLAALSGLNEGELETLRKFFAASPDQVNIERFCNDISNRLVFEEYSAAWTSSQAISSRHAFGAESDRIEFPAPMACTLVLQVAKEQRTKVTQALQSLLHTPLDASMANALSELITQLGLSTENEISLTMHACIGLEQIGELTSKEAFTIDTASKNLMWRGFMRQDQFEVLERWALISDFGETIRLLLSAMQERKVEVRYTLADPSVVPGPVPQLLGTRLKVYEATEEEVPHERKLVWIGLYLSVEEHNAMVAYKESLKDEVKQALETLLQSLSSPEEFTTTIKIMEPQWQPRPLGEHLPIDLQPHLLIAQGEIKAWGWLSPAEIEELRRVKAETDRRAINMLLKQVQGVGLQNAKLQLTAKRGTAGNAEGYIDSNLGGTQK
jgi:hypothetical protein